MILLMGIAGSGKGTQGDLLARQHGFKIIAMGDVVREQATPEQRQRMLAGNLLGDDETIAMLDATLAVEVDLDHVILDGFPRTITQAEWLLGEVAADRFSQPVAVHLVASRAAVTDRLLSRSRADDNTEAIEKRFDEYERSTAPILDWLSQHGVAVLSIDAERPVQEVYADIVKQLSL